MLLGKNNVYFMTYALECVDVGTGVVFSVFIDDYDINLVTGIFQFKNQRIIANRKTIASRGEE